MTSSPSTDLAAARVRAALLRLALIEAKAGFRKDQPRTPAGNHDQSGRWSGGSGSGGGGTSGTPAASGRAPPPTALAPTRPDMITAARQKVVGAINAAADKAVETAHEVQSVAEDAAARAWDFVPEPIRTSIEDAIATATPPVADFLVENRVPIARTLGALQAVGGAGEVAGGGSLGVTGAATGAGEAPALVLAGWMVGHGIDDVRVGVSTLISGHPEPSGLFLGFKALGLNDNAAAIGDLGLSTLAPGTLATLSQKELAQLAEPYLLRDSIEMMLLPGIRVVPKGSMWSIASPVERGFAFEKFDGLRLGLEPLPPGYRRIDFFDDVKGVAISDKTLDFRALRYAKEPFGRMGTRLDAMVDSVANFSGDTWAGKSIRLDQIQERRLHLAIPSGRVEPGQALLLRNMRAYAKKRGVKVQIFRVR